MALEDQVAKARMLAGQNQLYAAPLNAAYSATWKQVFLKAEAPEIITVINDTGTVDFYMTVTGNSFVAQAADAGPNSFLLTSNGFPILPGNAVRVRFPVEFSGGALTSGVMTVALVSTLNGEQVIQDIDADGIVDFTYTAPDITGDTYFITITGGTLATGGVSWDVDAVVTATLSVTPFPPAFGVAEFPLNPAIPFHRIVLAVPDNSFNCVVKVTFTNGGTNQGSSFEVAVGQQTGEQAILNPPCENLQARLSVPGLNGPLLLDSQTIFAANNALQSNRVAAFQWSAIADKVSFEIVRSSLGNGSPTGGLAIGHMQMPMS